MTDAPTWAAVDAAFDRALDLDGAARDAYLDGLAAPLRAAVDRLLREARRADDPLLDGRAPVLALLADADAEAARPDAFAGARVGPYRLDALVGEGGMGCVYRAHRADGAFEQTVAVKVVRQTLALAGADVSGRLRRERALLAALDHPGIARLLDGGETDDGVPYLVTEFVDGAPLTEWAEARALGVADRVRLVIEVARAVDHAHRRFVVHRDLKPSNVLVTERDGAARPVVLDFGIAKLLDAAQGDGSTAAPLTQTGLRLLTPAYAAPELFEPSADITTAADVYGLGALLYELLTGQRPHGDAPTQRARDAEATRPSRLLTADAVPPPGAALRARALRGDLDVICLKALHPDPARRYASAAALAADLQRHLDGRPVEARPDAIGYVVGRFARRHRATAAAALVAVAALVAGLSVALVSLGAERAARARAEAEAARADEAATLLAELFQAADPSDGEVVTVRQVLDAGTARTAELRSDTLRAYLDGVLGRTYALIGEVATADSLLAAALAADRRADALSPRQRARIQIDYGSTRAALDDPMQQLVLSQMAAEELRETPDDPLMLAALRGQSGALLAFDQTGPALVAADRALRLARRLGDPVETARALTERGQILVAARRADEALASLEEALALAETFEGRDRTYLTHALNAQGNALLAVRRFAEAEAAFRRSQAYLTRVFGGHTLGVGYTQAAAARALLLQGETARAAAAADSALAIGRAVLPADHPDLKAWERTRARADRPRDAALLRARARLLQRGA